MKSQLVARAPHAPQRGYHTTTTPREPRAGTPGRPKISVACSRAPKIGHYKGTHTRCVAPGQDSLVQSPQATVNIQTFHRHPQPNQLHRASRHQLTAPAVLERSRAGSPSVQAVRPVSAAPSRHNPPWCSSCCSTPESWLQ